VAFCVFFVLAVTETYHCYLKTHSGLRELLAAAFLALRVEKRAKFSLLYKLGRMVTHGRASSQSCIRTRQIDAEKTKNDAFLLKFKQFDR
jgi:hypothetical protein